MLQGIAHTRPSQAGFLLALASLLPGQALHAQSLPTLRTQVLALEQAALKLEAPNRHPQSFVLYLGGAPNAVIKAVTVRIDQQAPYSYRYSSAEGTALQGAGLHRLLSLPLPPGQHRIQADVHATDVADDHRLQRAQIDTTFLLTADTPSHGLLWSPGGRLSRASLQWMPLHTTGSTAQDADPRLRHVRFLSASGRQVLAASEWQQLQQDNPRLANSALPAMADAEPSIESAAYALYNQAVGLISQGRAAEGLTHLEQLAKELDCDGGHALLQCDRIHTVLGYGRLKQGEADAAITAFRRVHSPGPYASSALLGFGWAVLAPTGLAMPAGSASQPPPVAASQTPEQQARLRRQALEAALVPWTELIGRDPTDAAVDEGAIAVPWALQHLGLDGQAQDFYNRAIESLSRTLRRVGKAQDEARSQRFGAQWQTGDVPLGSHAWEIPEQLADARWWTAPDQPRLETFHLEPLLMRANFRAALAELRELDDMQQLLARHQQGLRPLASAEALAISTQMAALQPELAALRLRAAQRLDHEALDYLQALEQQLLRYLVAARYSLAQLYESPSPGGQP